jgi:hypothetical protein
MSKQEVPPPSGWDLLRDYMVRIPYVPVKNIVGPQKLSGYNLPPDIKPDIRVNLSAKSDITT